MLEVIQWAQDHAGAEQLYAVALVDDDNTLPNRQRRGLIWLVGIDANDTHADEPERRWYTAMLNRRGQRIIDLQ